MCVCVYVYNKSSESLTFRGFFLLLGALLRGRLRRIVNRNTTRNFQYTLTYYTRTIAIKYTCLPCSFTNGKRSSRLARETMDTSK